jgi:drug/metabolite transporter (DMT)-like permease
MGLEPIINPLIVALIYHEVLTTLAIIGAAIVFLSIFIYNYLNAKYPDPEDRS